MKKVTAKTEKITALKQLKKIRCNFLSVVFATYLYTIVTPLHLYNNNILYIVYI